MLVVKKTQAKCLKTTYIGSIVLYRHYICSSSTKIHILQAARATATSVIR